MAVAIRNNLDLGLNQLLAALVEVVAALPGTVTNGRVIYNTGDAKFYVGEGGTWRSFLITGTRLDQLSAPTAAVPLNAQRLTGLAAPTADADAATKAYVDGAVTSINWKDSVRVASTANIDLTTGTALTIDGIATAAGDRVLVKNQTAGEQNGIYVVAAGAWARASDANTADEIRGATVLVEEGTQGNTIWLLSTDPPITLGTTALSFVQFSSGGGTTYTAGPGLTLSTNDFSVNVDGTSLEINADTLRVKALGVLTGMIADGAVTLTGGAGQKVGGTLPVGNGGTGATTAAGARTNLGAVSKVSVDITGNGTAVSFTVTHNLGTTDVQVQVWEASTNAWVIVDIVRADANSVRIDFSVAPADLKVYRVVVMG